MARGYPCPSCLLRRKDLLDDNCGTRDSGLGEPEVSEPREYLLAGGAAELERLRLQARVWEPEVEVMLEMIGVAPGWRCIDLGCGAMGILGPLSRRAGPKGEVTGVDMDAKQLDAARAYVTGENLKNVKVLEQDAYNTKLPRESFDLTHVRFVFAPVGRDAGLLREMIALTRPGGTIAIQEPDAASWNSYPPNPSWMRLKEIILATFSAGGGGFYAGTRTFNLLRQARLRDDLITGAGVSPFGKKTHMQRAGYV